ncbi:hypothetical protein VFPPC_16210 [Pochonia chlamydosporia 170]|uniref:Uncharacterized protein n=1 Tax=Pochonia chlamydosporia 170 TaxID=1380566 RepID=A0A179FH93_METCM|nr:hypothetical protein VFPPC_16210 [Pochonia chlamydosporia 170]OAQ64419.1 hypothetical protein VFPPC_16210 [Pochonia chlamydosporia 170]
MWGRELISISTTEYVEQMQKNSLSWSDKTASRRYVGVSDEARSLPLKISTNGSKLNKK